MPTIRNKKSGATAQVSDEDWEKMGTRKFPYKTKNPDATHQDMYEVLKEEELIKKNLPPQMKVHAAGETAKAKNSPNKNTGK